MTPPEPGNEKASSASEAEHAIAPIGAPIANVDRGCGDT